jgi:hypothetical protein
MEMSRVILRDFMDHIRLTEGYIWFHNTNNHFNNHDIFIIKDGQNHYVLGSLSITDSGITIRRDKFSIQPVLEPGEIIFEKDFSDPDCNPRYISEVIDKMIMEDPYRTVSS